MRWSRPGACRRFQVASRGRPGDGWIGKGHDGCDNIAEQGWQPVVEILSASLCFPALLADSAVAGEHAAKRYEPGGPGTGPPRGWTRRVRYHRSRGAGTGSTCRRSPASGCWWFAEVAQRAGEVGAVHHLASRRAPARLISGSSTAGKAAGVTPTSTSSSRSLVHFPGAQAATVAVVLSAESGCTCSRSAAASAVSPPPRASVSSRSRGVVRGGGSWTRAVGPSRVCMFSARQSRPSSPNESGSPWSPAILMPSGFCSTQAPAEAHRRGAQDGRARLPPALLTPPISKLTMAAFTA
jgi:hypothetical protein